MRRLLGIGLSQELVLVVFVKANYDLPTEFFLESTLWHQFLNPTITARLVSKASLEFSETV